MVTPKENLGFLAYCVAKGKASLTADELARLGVLAGTYVKVGARVRPSADPQGSNIPAFTGTVEERLTDGRVRVVLDTPVALPSGGYEGTATELTLPGESVEALPASEDPQTQV